MASPRLEIDLGAIHSNARRIVALCRSKGIRITAVTKGVCGEPRIAAALIAGGIRSLGDSRLANIHRMRRAGIEAEFMLIRPPRASMVDRVVALADVSLNTEASVVRLLSDQAMRRGKIHDVILMVEMGDLREGIMPDRLSDTVEAILALEGVRLRGIGTNLACFNGVIPTVAKMKELSQLAEAIEQRYNLRLECVSGGNSANYEWLTLSETTGRVNHLRIGEALLLGRETVHREPIRGLVTDAFRLIGEVIEAKTKPSRPFGEIGQNAFGDVPSVLDQGRMRRAIVALGEQDVDPRGIHPQTAVNILGVSSDQLVLHDTQAALSVGSEVTLDIDYRALLRAMTSPYVEKVFVAASHEDFLMA